MYVSYPTELMFREVEYRRCGERSPSCNQGDLGGRQAPNICVVSQFRLPSFEISLNIFSYNYALIASCQCKAFGAPSSPPAALVIP